MIIKINKHKLIKKIATENSCRQQLILLLNLY